MYYIRKTNPYYISFFDLHSVGLIWVSPMWRRVHPKFSLVSSNMPSKAGLYILFSTGRMTHVFKSNIKPAAVNY